MDKERYIASIQIILVTSSYFWFKYLRKKCAKKRKFAVRNAFKLRKELGEYTNFFTEIKTSDPQLFFTYTRMSVNTFEDLLSLLRPRLEKKARTSRTLGAEERLAFTLRYLTTGDSQMTCGWSYRIGKSTASTIIRETCDIIWDVLQPIYLQPPSREDWETIANDFQHKWNLPHCCGGLDGKHIMMQAPPNSGTEFRNYKDHFSIVLLALCDANYRFTVADIGAMGSESDGGVLQRSEFGLALHSNVLNLPRPTNLPNSTINFPFFLVGDQAFPLKQSLMRPYPGQKLSTTQTIFNYRISRARRVVENSFGILVSRWRIFKKPIVASTKTVKSITKACVCLHNLLMNSRDSKTYCPSTYIDRETREGNFLRGQWRKEIDRECALRRYGRVASNNFTNNASQLRDTLATYLEGPGSVPWQNEWIRRGSEPGFIG